MKCLYCNISFESNIKNKKFCNSKCQQRWHYYNTKNYKEKVIENKNNWRKANQDKFRKWQQKYRKTHRKNITEYNKIYYKKYPLKMKAIGAVQRQIKNGNIKPVKELKCVKCGEQAIHYHHYLGYEKKHWLDVIPVCQKCHINIHKNEVV